MRVSNTDNENDPSAYRPYLYCNWWDGSSCQFICHRASTRCPSISSSGSEAKGFECFCHSYLCCYTFSPKYRYISNYYSSILKVSRIMNLPSIICRPICSPEHCLSSSPFSMISVSMAKQGSTSQSWFCWLWQHYSQSLEAWQQSFGQTLFKLSWWSSVPSSYPGWVWNLHKKYIRCLKKKDTFSNLGIKAAGGYERMLDRYSTSEPDPGFTAFTRGNVSCSKVNQDFMHLVRPPTDDTMPWTG